MRLRKKVWAKPDLEKQFIFMERFMGRSIFCESFF